MKAQSIKAAPLMHGVKQTKNQVLQVLRLL